MSIGMATPLPQWMRLLGAGLTGLLAVLFVVVLQQTREQGQRLQQLQDKVQTCLLYTSPSPRDATLSRMPSSA